MMALFQLDFQSHLQDWARFDLCYKPIVLTMGIHLHKYNTLEEKVQSSRSKLKPKFISLRYAFINLYCSSVPSGHFSGGGGERGEGEIKKREKQNKPTENPHPNIQ